MRGLTRKKGVARAACEDVRDGVACGPGDGRGGSRKRPPMQLIEVDQVEIESSANGGPDPVSDEELEEIVEGFLIKDGQQGPCGL